MAPEMEGLKTLDFFCSSFFMYKGSYMHVMESNSAFWVILGHPKHQAWLTIYPGMDIKRSFCVEVGVPASMVMCSYQRKKVVVELKDEVTPEALRMGPDDVPKVGTLRF